MTQFKVAPVEDVSAFLTPGDGVGLSQDGYWFCDLPAGNSFSRVLSADGARSTTFAVPLVSPNSTPMFRNFAPRLTYSRESSRFCATSLQGGIQRDLVFDLNGNVQSVPAWSGVIINTVGIDGFWAEGGGLFSAPFSVAAGGVFATDAGLFTTFTSAPGLTFYTTIPSADYPRSDSLLLHAYQPSPNAALLVNGEAFLQYVTQTGARFNDISDAVTAGQFKTDLSILSGALADLAPTNNYIFPMFKGSICCLLQTVQSINAQGLPVHINANFPALNIMYIQKQYFEPVFPLSFTLGGVTYTTPVNVLAQTLFGNSYYVVANYATPSPGGHGSNILFTAGNPGLGATALFLYMKDTLNWKRSLHYGISRYWLKDGSIPPPITPGILENIVLGVYPTTPYGWISYADLHPTQTPVGVVQGEIAQYAQGGVEVPPGSVGFAGFEA